MIHQNEIDEVRNMFDEIHYDLVSYYVDVNDRTHDKEKAKVRTIAPNEIIIEFDSDDKERVKCLVNRTIKRLNQQNYSYFVFNHGGRSPHIHIPAIYGLEQLDDEIRKQYKKVFIEEICSVWDTVYPEVDLSLTNKHQLIAREFMPHFKHNNVKELIDYHIVDRDKLNRIDIKILKQANHRIDVYSEVNNFVDNRNHGWFINWVRNNELEKGDRDILLYKNIAIFCVNNTIDVEPIINDIQRYDYSAGGEIRGWMKWAKSSKRFFNYREVERYCENHDLDILELIKKWEH